jgi:hypothetical protein
MSNVKVTTVHSSTSTMHVDELDLDVELPYGGEVAGDIVYVVPDGANYRLLWLEYDREGPSYNPIEDDEGVVWDSFRRGDPDRFDGDLEAVQDYLADNQGRAFLVECYQHGQDIYALKGSERANRFPDRRWDVGVAGIITVPTDVPDDQARGYAAGVMESYTSYVNGDCYGIVELTIDPTGKVLDEDACWGYLGYDYATAGVKAQAGVES